MGDRFGYNIFDDRFRENAMVLDTSEAMSLVTEFSVNVSSSLKKLEFSPEVISNFEGKGKLATGGHPGQSGRTLGEYLRRNQSLQTALSVWHRTLEAVLRWKPESDMHIGVDLKEYHQVIDSLLVKVGYI